MITADIFFQKEQNWRKWSKKHLRREQVQIKVILFIKSIQKGMIFLKFMEKKTMVFDFWFWELWKLREADVYALKM